MKVVPTVGVVAFNDNNEVVLVKHGEKASNLTGVYGLPSGRYNLGESDVDAAIREFEEETGLHVEKEDLVFVKEYVADIQRKEELVRMPWKVFVCRKYSGELRKANDETAPEFVKVNEVGKFNLLPNIENAIQAASEVLEGQGRNKKIRV